MKVKTIDIPGLNSFHEEHFIFLDTCSDGIHKVNQNGVEYIVATRDRKIELIVTGDKTTAYLLSSSGYPAYYPLNDTKVEKPVKAVLMDLDGTTVRSEDFWIWIIEQTCQSLLDSRKFELEDSDIPFVSGHSVSEHLMYCLNKYCPDKGIDEARSHYFKHTHQEMDKIMKGCGREDAFTPTEGIKDFLLELKSRNIRIGLVTSGLYEKAFPEILSAFMTLKMGDPKEFYDTIITAGYPLRKGAVGTLGELCPKPHPWLYAEAAAVGLGMSYDQRHHIVCIEDSSAGICSIKLAGFSPIGISGGNIIKGGTYDFCDYYHNDLEGMLGIL